MKEIKIRCSSLDGLMATQKQRTLPFNDTQIGKLIELYAEQIEGRREEVTSKFMEKGTLREEDSITLLSRITKIVYNKNEQRLTNDYISGLPDLYEGESIEKADKIIDIKTSWNRITFLKSKICNWADDYKWQVMGYMALTGAKEATLSFCLVNGTAASIMAEKKKLAWASTFMDVEQDPIYKEKCRQVEINQIFDIEHFVNENPGFDFDNDIDKWLDKKTWDIPMEKRINLTTITRNEADIQAIYDRVGECRKWINENLF